MNRRPALVVMLVLVSVALVAGLTWIVVVAVNLYGDAANTSERAASVQAVAAAVSLVATVLLVAVTAWYTMLTRDMVRQSGPVVTADLRVGWLPPMGGSAFITAPVAHGLKPPDKNYTVPTWAIVLSNSGNADTKVSGLVVEADVGFSVRALQTVVGPAPTFVLEAQAGETVCIEMGAVLAGVDAWRKVMGRQAKRVRATVELGSGVKVTSKWHNLR